MEFAASSPADGSEGNALWKSTSAIPSKTIALFISSRRTIDYVNIAQREENNWKPRADGVHRYPSLFEIKLAIMSEILAAINNEPTGNRGPRATTAFHGEITQKEFLINSQRTLISLHRNAFSPPPRSSFRGSSFGRIRAQNSLSEVPADFWSPRRGCSRIIKADKNFTERGPRAGSPANYVFTEFPFVPDSSES